MACLTTAIVSDNKKKYFVHFTEQLDFVTFFQWPGKGFVRCLVRFKMDTELTR